MSYDTEDTINWWTIAQADRWLDGEVSHYYQIEPLAQDWARVSKIGEELGEAIAELILSTGQNPRKDCSEEAMDAASIALLKELGDVAITAILAIQHFTKHTENTKAVLMNAQAKLKSRVPDIYGGTA